MNNITKTCLGIGKLNFRPILGIFNYTNINF